MIMVKWKEEKQQRQQNNIVNHFNLKFFFKRCHRCLAAMCPPNGKY